MNSTELSAALDRGHTPLDSSSESTFAALRAVRDEICGDPSVCVAVLDGPVDLDHPCFRGAQLTRVDTLVDDRASAGAMSKHGTHVASVIFGQPSSGTLGLAPRCRGLLLPIFRDGSGYLSQLELARAIERAVMEGANIINISGGERVPGGRPDALLARALDLCEQSNVLVVAAVGNDGCDCHHVPAAAPPTVAVGAMDRAGVPLASSNYGELYRTNGVLAPGEAIPGAVPGGAIVPLSGSSFATPIVSALAALMMCLQRRDRQSVDANEIREAILRSATPCPPGDGPECSRYLAGTLNVRGTYARTTRGGEPRVSEFDAGSTASGAQPGAAPWGAPIAAGAGVAPSVDPSHDTGGGAAWGGAGGAPDSAPTSGSAAPSAAAEAGGSHAGGAAANGDAPAGGVQPSDAAAGVVASCGCGGSPPAQAPDPGGAGLSAQGVAPSVSPPAEGVTPSAVADAPVVPAPVIAAVRVPVPRIFAIGNVGFDFGTEARRDTFRQLMPRVTVPDTDPEVVAPPNPYDTTQLADYLDANRYESTKIIWTLNLDLTPIYAIEADMSYAEDVYAPLRIALRNQSLPSDDLNFVSRVSIPGTLTNRSVRLYSGQVVPVVVAQPRGLYLWNERALVDEVISAIDPDQFKVDPDRVRLTVTQMLDKIYYQLRNLGQSPPDRAINFQATNAFVFTSAIAKGLLSGQLVDCDASGLYSLDQITAIKSPFCRVDSDCWDVQITFFDPENDNRSRVAFQSTIDVSDELPVQLAPTRQFLFAS